MRWRTTLRRSKDVTEEIDAGVSRRDLISAGGASAALLVLSPRGLAAAPSAIALPAASQETATSGYGFLLTMSLLPAGTLTLTKVSADGATTIAEHLSKAVVSPDRESAVYAQGPVASPHHAPSAYSVLHGDQTAGRPPALHLTDLGNGPSFTNSCVLPGAQGVVVTCVDLANSTAVAPGGGKRPTQAFALHARFVTVSKASGTVSITLPVADGDFIGAEVVPIDDRHAAVITSGLTRKITGKANGPLPPNTSAHCFIVDTVRGRLSGHHRVLAGPGAAHNISWGNGVVARVVGGPEVELIYPSRPPVSYPAPLTRHARPYAPTGYADPASGTLVLFDFALARLLKLDLNTGQVTARSDVPLRREALPRVTRPAVDVDAEHRQLLLADPSNPRSGVWIVDLDKLAVADRWLSLMPVGDIRVIPAADRVVVRAPGSTTALLLDHNGQVAGNFGLAGQLI